MIPLPTVFCITVRPGPAPRALKIRRLLFSVTMVLMVVVVPLTNRLLAYNDPVTLAFTVLTPAMLLRVVLVKSMVDEGDMI